MVPDKLNIPARLRVLQRPWSACLREMLTRYYVSLAHMNSSKGTQGHAELTLRYCSAEKQNIIRRSNSITVKAQNKRNWKEEMMLFQLPTPHSATTKVLLFTNVWMGTKFSRDEICCYGNRARLKKSFKQQRLYRAIWSFLLFRN